MIQQELRLARSHLNPIQQQAIQVDLVQPADLLALQPPFESSREPDAVGMVRYVNRPELYVKLEARSIGKAYILERPALPILCRPPAVRIVGTSTDVRV